MIIHIYVAHPVNRLYPLTLLQKPNRRMPRTAAPEEPTVGGDERAALFNG
jgi:hypothetical protein